MAHPARIPGSPIPHPIPSQRLMQWPADQEQSLKDVRSLLPDRRTLPCANPHIRLPVSPSTLNAQCAPTFANPPAFLISLPSSPAVRWSGFSLRSRAIASTSSWYLPTSRARYPSSPPDKNLGVPRFPLSSEIFSSSGEDGRRTIS